MREVKRPDLPAPTLADRIVSYFDPVAGIKRQRARAFGHMLDVQSSYTGMGGYFGGSKTRRALSQWLTMQRDADRDILPDLPTLRNRSRDLCRNAPLALGAINTKVLNVVGAGLRLHSRVDAEFLGMTPEEADAWQRTTEREFDLWAQSQNCDATRHSDFYSLQELAFRSVLESGDVFVLLPAITLTGWPYATAIQLVEADRVCNKDNGPDTATLSGGVEKTSYGAPINYHFLKSHPGNYTALANRVWEIVPAFGAKTGRRNVLHLYRKLRPDQTRGVPDLAPVMETLKQLDRYTEAEVMAAVITGMFAVFFKTESDSDLAPVQPVGESGALTSDDDRKLVSGMIGNLAPGESIECVDPKRPNIAFDPFVQAVLRQVGVALELPFEVLIKHFTASYSASRAALLEAWRFFKARRKWMAANFCAPIYETWMAEAVASGRIVAPGFFADAAIRAAYLGADWIGSSPGHIQPLQEAEAEQTWIDMGVKTIAEVTSEATGGDWDLNHRQRVREVTLRREAGLEQDLTTVRQQDQANTPQTAPPPKQGAPARKSQKFAPGGPNAPD